jgi:hypothetical protein
MNNYSWRQRQRNSPAALYCTSCTSCGARTSKSYARAHEGKCKACATGEPAEYRGPKCPQCGGPRSRYQEQRGYVCEGCTRANDPEGYRREVMGLNDFGGY